MRSVDDGEIDDIRQKVEAAGPLPAAASLTNSAKGIKDLLQRDPSNILLIRDLGFAYARDGQWRQCGNVLHRGRRRLDELEGEGERLAYGLKLCEALYHAGRPGEALAALRGIPEPADPARLRDYSVVACLVHASSGGRQAALRSFVRAIDGVSFDSVMSIWALTRSDLKKVGAYDGAKGAVKRLAANGEDLSRLSTLEDLADVAEEDRNRPQAVQGQRPPLAKRLRLYWATFSMRRILAAAARKVGGNALARAAWSWLPGPAGGGLRRCGRRRHGAGAAALPG